MTICAHRRRCIFGDAVAGEAVLNPYGKRVEKCRLDLPRHFPAVTLDALVVMPNHIHGIVVIEDADLQTWRVEGRGAACRAPAGQRFSSPVSGSLGTIIGSLKSAAARAVNRARATRGAAVWQRNYHEHVIRNEEDLDEARKYIADNPSRWAFDRENPAMARRKLPGSR